MTSHLNPISINTINKPIAYRTYDANTKLADITNERNSVLDNAIKIKKFKLTSNENTHTKEGR